jgi:excisionase family DNA binding protein
MHSYNEMENIMEDKPFMSQHPDDTLTLREIATMFNVAERTVRRWVQSGELRSERDIIGRYVVKRSDLEAFQRARYQRFNPNDDDE